MTDIYRAEIARSGGRHGSEKFLQVVSGNACHSSVAERVDRPFERKAQALQALRFQVRLFVPLYPLRGVISEFRACVRLSLFSFRRAAVPQELFDLARHFVTARAVASLPVLAELCLPLVKQGGIFIAFKTRNESVPSAGSLSLLGGRLKETFTYSLPSGDGRLLFVFEKTSPTDSEYPRNYGKIKKSPLY